MNQGTGRQGWSDDGDPWELVKSWEKNGIKVAIWADEITVSKIASRKQRISEEVATLIWNNLVGSLYWKLDKLPKKDDFRMIDIGFIDKDGSICLVPKYFNRLLKAGAKTLEVTKVLVDMGLIYSYHEKSGAMRHTYAKRIRGIVKRFVCLNLFEDYLRNLESGMGKDKEKQGDIDK